MYDLLTDGKKRGKSISNEGRSRMMKEGTMELISEQLKLDKRLDIDHCPCYI